MFLVTIQVIFCNIRGNKDVKMCSKQTQFELKYIKKNQFECSIELVDLNDLNYVYFKLLKYLF